MAHLAENFVNVRIQSMNGVNLNHFPFEYDLTWMSFFQDAEGRTYTRYGGREDHDAESHLNKGSLLGVMRQVLKLHQDKNVQPDNRYEPTPKSLKTPEHIPTMKHMLSQRKEKCIHCHDVKAATLRHHRELGLLKKDMVYTYPSPSRLGIHLDPVIQNQVESVKDDSTAKQAGIREGDIIRAIDSQRVLTFADASRVLELAPKMGELQFDLLRGNRNLPVSVQLPEDWRNNDDPSWRSTTGSVGPLSGIWGMRANEKQRRQAGLENDVLAMRVTYIWATWARKSGIKLGDFIISVDGYKGNMTIRQLQAYVHLNKNWGDKITVIVRRDKKDVKLTFQFPDKPPNG